MSPVSMGGSWQDEPPLARKFAHSYTYASFALVAWGIWTAGPWFDAVAHDWAWWQMFLLFALPWSMSMTWAMFAMVCHFKHPMAVCVRCLTDIPADGAVQAKRKWRRLRMSHLRQTGQFLRWNTGVLIVALAIGVADWGPLKWTSAVALVGWWSVTAYGTVSERTHLQLGPWCPYCKGGGDEDPTPTAPVVPDPSGTKVAS